MGRGVFRGLATPNSRVRGRSLLFARYFSNKFEGGGTFNSSFLSRSRIKPKFLQSVVSIIIIVIDGHTSSIGMAVLYYRPKTGFWAQFSQMLTDLE